MCLISLVLGLPTPGLSPSTPVVTLDDVKQAFRDLAKKHHPDKVASSSATKVQRATEVFRNISRAYEVLSNSARRQEHERTLKAPEEQPHSSARATSNGFSFSFGGGGGGFSFTFTF